MGKLLESIGKREVDFIASQKVFFVATAPLSRESHVNLSPKAPGSSLQVLSSNEVAYLDLSGSGAETAAHILQNSRLTILFCNLESGAPRILRLHGTAKVIPKEDGSSALMEKFPSSLTQSHGFRAIYLLKVKRISSSCGYSLPIMEFQEYRTTLADWTKNRGPQGMAAYGLQKNSYSIDGIPSIGMLRNSSTDFHIVPDPSDGYIFGKRVSSSWASRALHNLRIMGMPKVDAYGLTMFLLGAMMASLIQTSSRLGGEDL